MQFDELVPGAAVRFTVIDGVQYLSIRDFIMAVCNKDGNHASDMWRCFSPEYKNELTQFLGNFKFPGRGQQNQSVITFDGALTLMNWLPGENAKKWRGKTTQILKRYFAGDPTLLDDIQANAESNAPINQAARAAMDKQPAIEDDFVQNMVKRRKIQDEFTVSVYTAAKQVKDYSSALSACNENLEKHIELKSRLYSVEIHHDHDKLGVERAKLELAKETHRHELEVRKALKALDQPDPDTTTILKVYETTKDAYSLLRADQRKPFLVKAGVYAARDYVLQNGVHPNKVSERGQDVNAYPLSAECILRDALKTSYAEITAGKAQPRIDAAIWRRVPAPV